MLDTLNLWFQVQVTIYPHSYQTKIRHPNFSFSVPHSANLKATRPHRRTSSTTHLQSSSPDSTQLLHCISDFPFTSNHLFSPILCLPTSLHFSGLFSFSNRFFLLFCYCNYFRFSSFCFLISVDLSALCHHLRIFCWIYVVDAFYFRHIVHDCSISFDFVSRIYSSRDPSRLSSFVYPLLYLVVCFYLNLNYNSLWAFEIGVFLSVQ